MIYIFVTGGVVSGLGKGIVAASIARLLKRHMTVNIIKLDGYLNIDPGTQRPDEHGEVFVTDCGAETDLDLGHYERFTDLPMTKNNSITMGQIYSEILDNERDGKYLGKTVQVVPHVTNKIQEKIKAMGENYDALIVEVGGTVGDIEVSPILEAIRSIDGKCVHIHLSKLDCETGSIKTKPIQNSIRKLGEMCITPDIVFVRSYKDLTDNDKVLIKSKLNKVRHITFGETIECIYDIPTYFESQNILNILGGLIGFHPSNERVTFVKRKPNLTSITIGLGVKYTGGADTYISVIEALRHVQNKVGVDINVEYIDCNETYDDSEYEKYDGFMILGGFGDKAIENKISLANYSRENKKPLFGICLGLQVMVIEYARNVCGIKNATSKEFNLVLNPENVIDLMESQAYVNQVGGTMRLGAYPCDLLQDSIAYSAYKKITINERHRHRYEVSNDYGDKLKENGLRFTGFHTKMGLVEIIELSQEVHPWYVGVQFHPEFKSRPDKPHPLFSSFIESILSTVRWSDE